MADKFIVIVDDDKNDRFLIKHALKQKLVSLIVLEFSDGEQIIEFIKDKCAEKAPSCILLDLNMPKKSGFEVLEYMVSNPTLCKVPVIVLSTSSSEGDISRAKALGATEYLVKPDDFKGYNDLSELLVSYLE